MYGHARGYGRNLLVERPDLDAAGTDRSGTTLGPHCNEEHPVNIADSFENVLDTIIGFIPNLLGFVIILLIGYVVAKVVASVVRKVLEKIGIDRKVQESEANRYVDAVLPGATPSGGIARLVFWLVFVFFLVTAIGALGIPTATNFMNQVLAFLPNVIVAILIFVVAALLSGAVAGGVSKVMGDTTTGKVVAAVVPALIMVIAMFMILEQLQIAPEIVRIAFAAVMFAIALALALAFGLGGRDVAARLLEDAHRKTRENADTIKADLAQGRDRAQQEAGAADPTRSSADYEAGTGYSATELANVPAGCWHRHHGSPLSLAVRTARHPDTCKAGPGWSGLADSPPPSGTHARCLNQRGMGTGRRTAPRPNIREPACCRPGGTR